jgi:site-specific recombinase XerC
MTHIRTEVNNYKPECHELLGHKFLKTTMIYTYLATKNILGVRSPLDK